MSGSGRQAGLESFLASKALGLSFWIIFIEDYAWAPCTLICSLGKVLKNYENENQMTLKIRIPSSGHASSEECVSKAALEMPSKITKMKKNER